MQTRNEEMLTKLWMLSLHPFEKESSTITIVFGKHIYHYTGSRVFSSRLENLYVSLFKDVVYIRIDVLIFFFNFMIVWKLSSFNEIKLVFILENSYMHVHYLGEFRWELISLISNDSACTCICTHKLFNML